MKLRLIAALLAAAFLCFAPPSRALLQLQGAGPVGGSSVCVLWTPANLATAPRYIFDPSTFTYTGSNFTSGSNTGSVGGSWTIESGTPAKGTALNGLTTISFAGGQGFINSTAAWPATNVFIIAVATVGTVQGNSLFSSSWGLSEGRDATHGWVFYPRGGTALGGGANFAWLFQGTGAAVINQGNLFVDTNPHVVAIQAGTTQNLILDGTTGTNSGATGAISASLTNNVRVGESDAGQEQITATVAYIAVLQNPTTIDYQKYIGWAAWRFGLQANLPGGFPYAAAPPCQ